MESRIRELGRRQSDDRSINQKERSISADSSTRRRRRILLVRGKWGMKIKKKYSQAKRPEICYKAILSFLLLFVFNDLHSFHFILNSAQWYSKPSSSSRQLLQLNCCIHVFITTPDRLHFGAFFLAAGLVSILSSCCLCGFLMLGFHSG